MSEKQTRRAVLISLSEEGGGLRMVLDDVVSDSQDHSLWKKDVHFTNKKYSKSDIENLKFSDEELADIGLYVLARLKAFLSRGEN